MAKKSTSNGDKKPGSYGGGKSSNASVDFNKTSERKGTKGSCESGDLKACKTKVVKKAKFNPSKGTVAKGRVVKSKPEAPAEKKANSTGQHSNPRFL